MQAILDTNALVYAAKQKVHLYALLKDYEPILLSCVARELEELSKEAKKGADKLAAKLALQIAKQKAKLIVAKGSADIIILNYAKMHKAIVVTNDKELKRKAKSLGVDAVSVSRNKLRQ